MIGVSDSNKYMLGRQIHVQISLAFARSSPWLERTNRMCNSIVAYLIWQDIAAYL